MDVQINFRWVVIFAWIYFSSFFSNIVATWFVNTNLFPLTATFDTEIKFAFNTGTCNVVSNQNFHSLFFIQLNNTAVPLISAGLPFADFSWLAIRWFHVLIFDWLYGFKTAYVTAYMWCSITANAPFQWFPVYIQWNMIINSDNTILIIFILNIGST